MIRTGTAVAWPPIACLHCGEREALRVDEGFDGSVVHVICQRCRGVSFLQRPGRAPVAGQESDR